MDFDQFRKEYLENVKAIAAAENKGSTEAFVEYSCDHLINNDQFDEYELSYYVGRVGKRKFRIDAYSHNEMDHSFCVIISDYSGDEICEKLNVSDVNSLLKQANVVIKESLTGKLKDEVEMSTPAYDFVDRLHNMKEEIRKIQIFMITDKSLGEKALKISNTVKIEDIQCEYLLWDMARFYRVLDSADGHESIEIDLTEINGVGVPCLKASTVDIDFCQCYLSVLPGALLADMYDKYGSRLMEGNVRTFLSARGNVNKGIRKTILSDNKKMFFTYNNGIAATASTIETELKDGQLYITKITNLQIVNGGQTTASLSNTRYKDKVDLDGIFVQMKLTVVEDQEQAGEIIPNISRYSNNQNKVSEADFFSNHEFNIRMQQLSRKVFAPAALGEQHETHWFYERARGQYENEQSKLTTGQKKQFKLVNPKEQKFDKTALAKIENAWRKLPHVSSAGAQKSFKCWADIIVNEWKTQEDNFNELYYKDLIATLIIFRFLEKEIPKQSWYESGYRANIIVYSISFFNMVVEKQFQDRILDRKIIWNKQNLGEALQVEYLRVAQVVFKFITNKNRPVMNVTEWCKREDCWTACQKVNFKLSDDIQEALAYKSDVNEDKKDSKKTQKSDNAIAYQIDVVNKGSDFWKSLSLFAMEKHLLNEKEMSLLAVAIRMNSGKLPTERQSKMILEILEKAKDEGFVE